MSKTRKIDSNTKLNKSTYTRLIVIIIVLLVLLGTGTVQFYLPELLTNSAFQSFEKSKLKRLIEVLINISYVACVASLVTAFITSRIQKIEHSKFINRLDEKIEDLKFQTISTLHGMPVPSEFLQLVDQKIFKSHFFRRNVHITIHFHKNRYGQISEKMIWKFEIVNRTEEDKFKDFIIAVHDKEERVTLDSVIYYQSDDVQEKVISRSPTVIHNEHKVRVPIKAKDFTFVTLKYSLNFGIKGDYYHNAIWFKEPLIGIAIDVVKPKGHLFDVLISSGDTLISSKDNKTSLSTNENAEYLEYRCNNPQFPGVAIEYMLLNQNQKQKKKS